MRPWGPSPPSCKEERAMRRAPASRAAHGCRTGAAGTSMGSPRRAPRAGREYICAQSLYATDPPHQIHVRFDACGGDRRRLRSRAPLIPHRASPGCLTTWPAPRSPVPDLGKGGNSKFGGSKTPVVGRVVSYYLDLIRFLCTSFRSVTTCCVLSASRSTTDVELYATIR